ncbi:HMA domain-containing protein [Cephalotus follicularis]|uniref:HMA domain-containing protein n=1 Tax=Cephalotus follicularis TaxID=3775 RepID=A0A1Q3C6B6_CEPFO|nr:HMA domain-containing protein [Cephalotus follicularis]
MLSEYELLNIETHVLKMNINCLGCQKKVKKLLRKIEGVHSVNIDAEHQVVIVSGRVDPSVLINKLMKSGKHAELWSASFNHKLNHERDDFIKGVKRNEGQYLINDLNSTKTQHMIPTYFESETEDYSSLGNYLNQNVGMKAVTGEVDQNFIALTDMEIGQKYWDIDTFASNSKLEYNIATMMGGAGFQGNHAGYIGLGGHEIKGLQDYLARMPTYDYDYQPFMQKNMEQEFHHIDYSTKMPTYDYGLLPSMMMNNFQQGNHYNYPPTEMVNIYMHDRHPNGNTKVNGNMWIHQPHYGFGSAQQAYY